MSPISTPRDRWKIGGIVLTITLMLVLAPFVAGVIPSSDSGGVASAATQPQPQQRLVYTSKFICGLVQTAPSPVAADEPPVKPGNYATGINVHNFLDQSVNLTVNEAVATALLDGVETGGQVSQSRQITVGAGGAIEFDCSDLLASFNGTGVEGAEFVKGFFRIETTDRVEVAAVYTAQPVNIEMESVLGPKQVLVNLNTGYNQSTGTVLSGGSDDDDWEIVFPQSVGTFRPAVVVNQSVVSQHWPPALTNSAWISTDQGGKPDVQPGESITYRYNFTLTPGSLTNARVDLTIRSDNLASVFLNGQLVGQTVGTSPSTLRVTSPLQVGTNTLDINVEDTDGTVTGLDVRGNVSVRTETTETKVVLGPGISTDVEYIDPHTLRGR